MWLCACCFVGLVLLNARHSNDLRDPAKPVRRRPAARRPWNWPRGCGQIAHGTRRLPRPLGGPTCDPPSSASALVLLLSAGPLQAQSVLFGPGRNPEVAAMLGATWAERIEAERADPGRLRHAGHAVGPRRPGPRHRRGPASITQPSSSRSAPSRGGRLVVETDEFHPAGGRSRAEADAHRQRRRHPAGHVAGGARTARRSSAAITTRSPGRCHDAAIDAPARTMMPRAPPPGGAGPRDGRI